VIGLEEVLERAVTLCCVAKKSRSFCWAVIGGKRMSTKNETPFAWYKYQLLCTVKAETRGNLSCGVLLTSSMRPPAKPLRKLLSSGELPQRQILGLKAKGAHLISQVLGRPLGSITRSRFRSTVVSNLNC
jgi:hypothetical protein